MVLHDPFVKSYSRQKIAKDIYKALEKADLIFIGTRHQDYLNLDRKKLKQVVNQNCLVCDVWNVFGTGKIIFKLQDRL